MSTRDTGLSNLNIWEGTIAQIKSADIGPNDLAFAKDVAFEEQFRLASMPEASINYAGKIVQYIGGTRDEYTQGSFYKCTTFAAYIDVITESAFSLSFSGDEGKEQFEDYCARVDEASGKTTAYVELTCYDTPYNPNNFKFTCYQSNGTPTGTITTGPVSTLNDYGFIHSGVVYTETDIRIYRGGNYEWVPVSVNQGEVNWSEIAGDPSDNQNLTNLIENYAVTQVETLPVVTEDNKDKIYQYTGNDDIEHNFYKGSFYFADEARWELDRENSYLADDMYVEVTDEEKFLSWLRAFWYGGEPNVEWLEVCFDRGNTTDVEIWIDTTLYPSYTPYRQSVYEVERNYALKVIGNPTATNDRSTCTRVRINVYKLNDYSDWSWKPLNMYPTPYASNISLYNIAKQNTSIIEHSAGSLQNTIQLPYSVVIGVNAKTTWDVRGYSVAIGYNSTAGFMSTAIGYDTYATNGSVVIGYGAQSNGEYGIAIGNGNKVAERSVSIGLLNNVKSWFAGALGYYAEIGENARYSMAIGYEAKATAEGAYQLGEGTNSSTNTLQFKTYTLLDSNGTIPVQRLSTSTPQDGYTLVYDNNTGKAQWQNLSADIPVIQVTEMPEAEEGMVVQYIGEDDGELIKGYWYEAVYNRQGDYWYWNQINVQPEASEISYDNLTDKPSIDGITIEGDLNLVEDFGLARVAQTGSYADLTTKPGINGHALLSNTSASDLEISYDDLVDKPLTLPELPADKNEKDYTLKWDHTLGALVWVEITE